MRLQMNTILFQKTLVRKDVASSSSSSSDSPAAGADASSPTAGKDGEDKKDAKDDEDDFSSKAQVMTLFTTDVDRVSEFAWHIFTLVGKHFVTCSLSVKLLSGRADRFPD